MRIDIGCSSNKEKGYLGIDLVEGPDVDIVCDINQGIPLPDNTAEFVMASRVMPYVSDLFVVMSEIQIRQTVFHWVHSPQVHHSLSLSIRL
ncbi:hypothetical protein [Paenibacillus glacialis]|uniref:Methyltransferase type 11 domain-containing protein n=1 Tax=Paenibacillus glacialis TaxID=494026 RepID=A0A162KCV4_9BACL|nr:hypothetical protein [Paenibacillus glacialis]OAB44788.1 hypothetical protein PGLA_05085 [Paenibacillus glacialis]